MLSHGPNTFLADARQSNSEVKITVENRDYHHLSQSEIAGGKRISQHLFDAEPFWLISSLEITDSDEA